MIIGDHDDKFHPCLVMLMEHEKRLMWLGIGTGGGLLWMR